MSKEKLYAVKNDLGKYFDFKNQDGLWPLCAAPYPATSEKEFAKETAVAWGGHVVTFVEEPEKVVLTKEQAKIVENARDYPYPSRYIFDYADYYSGIDVELLIKAYVKGYTVAKEKRYNVKVPHTDYTWYLKTPDGKLDTIFVKGLSKGFGGYPDGIELTNDDIEKFGLQDCEKEEVTDNGK